MASLLPRLIKGDILAFPRGRFALAGTALLAALLALLAATLGTGMAGLDNFLVVAYIIVPTSFAPMVAVQVASLRSSRFAYSLYTTPLSEREVLLGKTLATLVLGGGLLLIPLPFVAVASWHLGLHPQLLAFLATGAGLILFGACFGAAVAVLLPGRTLAPPVAVTSGFMMLSLVVLPFALGVYSREIPPDLLLAHALRLSPHLLLVDATSLAVPTTGLVPSDPLMSLGIFVAECFALLGIASWVYSREQSADGWDTAPARRIALVLLAVGIVAAPAAALPNYGRLPSDEMVNRGATTQMLNASAYLALPGTDPSSVPFGDHWSAASRDALEVGAENRRDLLVLVHAKDGPLLDVVLTIEGLDGLRLVPSGTVVIGDVMEPPRAHQEPPSWALQEGIREGSVLRIPVVVVPGSAQDMTGNPMHIRVQVDYVGDGAPRAASVLFPVRADVPHAHAQMLVAGVPAILAFTSAAVARRIRIS